jgi:ubiquinol-cytochrome c reductase cytochrome b subunit
MFRIWFWLLVADFIMLMWCGSQPPEQPFVIMSQIGTFYWFAFFLVILPILGVAERPQTPPDSIEADFRAHYGTGQDAMARAAVSKPAE